MRLICCFWINPVSCNERVLYSTTLLMFFGCKKKNISKVLNAFNAVCCRSGAWGGVCNVCVYVCVVKLDGSHYHDGETVLVLSCSGLFSL